MTNDPIQQIAAVARSEVGSALGKLLLYAEVEGGVVSADLFHQPHPANSVKFRFASKHLLELVYRFWITGAPNISSRTWRCASLVLEGASFTLDLAYPNQVSADEDLSDRRPRAVAAHFPGCSRRLLGSRAWVGA